MQLHRWKKFGHRYLGRMVWTSLLLILLPCLIALFVMMQQAYSGILDHTRTNYATGVRDFSTEFVRRLDSYRSMAMRWRRNRRAFRSARCRMNCFSGWTNWTFGMCW